MFTNMNQDLPITAICVLTDRLKCPPNYTPIFRSYDANAETDLWKDGLFGRKINRFICYTKDYPINETYNVIEDIKLLNERENMLGGFIPVDKCYDNNEKCFQKKQLCIKVSHRYFTNMAVSDIIILVKNKRPPSGYSFIGEINNHTLCVKFSAIESKPASNMQSSASSNQIASGGHVPSIPPIPPRPASFSQNIGSIEQSYVHVPRPSSEQPATAHAPNDFYSTLQRGQSVASSVYNPLQGVPFELNPIYDMEKTNNNILDLNHLESKFTSSNHLLNRISYDFGMEKNLVETA